MRIFYNNFLYRRIIFLALIATCALHGEKMVLPHEEVDFIGDKIYRNECGRQAEYLVAWNYGEEFASLGIGHFIWYPANQSKKFSESFIDLLIYFKENQVKTPAWLNDSPTPCPWHNYQDFINNKHDPKIDDLRTLLKNTIALQTAFIIRRQQEAMSKIIISSADSLHEKLLKQYQRMAESPKGFYPLADYVNFKGEGVLESERYHGQGWGLLQVLLEMEGNETGAEAIKEFAMSAEKVLKRRIKNSPPERGELRWQSNWQGRVRRYITDCF